MQLKPIVAAAALALASVSSFAVNTNLGNIDGMTEGVGNAFTAPTPFFSDTFVFSLTSADAVSGFAFSSGISNFTVLLLDSGFMTLGTDTTPVSFSFSGLSAGTYALQFIGFGATNGSFYGGQVTAVPEPETYALMLAGLGAMGFIASRRRRG